MSPNKKADSDAPDRATTCCGRPCTSGSAPRFSRTRLQVVIRTIRLLVLLIGSSLSAIVWIAPAADGAPTVSNPTWRLAQYTYTRFPISCGSEPLAMLETVSTEPASGADRLLVLVQCAQPGGFGRTELLVYDGELLESGSPVPVQFLVSPSDGWFPSPYVHTQIYSTASSGDIKFTVCGFSSARVPIMLPNVFTTLSWRWTGPRYVLDSHVPAHSRELTG